jgi:hypothetical protein
MRVVGDIQNSVHEKSHAIQRNFSQFRKEYGIDGSKKKQAEFRVDGIPWTP